MIGKLCAPFAVAAGQVVPGRAEPDGGFAAVDALVALSIISLAMALSVDALTQASRAASSALEVRRAEILIRHLLEGGPRTYGAFGGGSDGFAWRLETLPTGAERPIAVCRRAVALKHMTSGRGYGASTLETCPPSEGL